MSENTSDPVVLSSFPTEAEATLVVSQLRSEGIEAQVSGGHTAGFRAAAPPMVQVLVHAKDAERARQILGDRL
jgi:hypothetical protein